MLNNCITIYSAPRETTTPSRIAGYPVYYRRTNCPPPAVANRGARRVLERHPAGFFVRKCPRFDRRRGCGFSWSGIQ